MVAAVIGALVAVLVVVLVYRFLLSAEVKEDRIGCFHRRILRAVPLQALKIIVVVWQILTQVGLLFPRFMLGLCDREVGQSVSGKGNDAQRCASRWFYPVSLGESTDDDESAGHMLVVEDIKR